MSAIRFLALLLALEALACGLFLWATPPGEGPDEPAHLYYVRHLAELAAGMEPSGPFGYEAHHPPLYYLLAAEWSRAWNADLDYPFLPNPAYPASKHGGAFLLPPASEPAAAALTGVRRLRVFSLIFTLATVAALFEVARRAAGGDVRLALLASAPFLLSPQLAFLGGVVSNDALTFAICAWALLLLQRIHGGENGLALGVAAGLATALAPWTKASGLFLTVPLLAAAGRLGRDRNWRGLAALLLPTLAGWSWWIASRLEGLEGLRRSAGELHLGLASSPDLLSRYPSFWAQLWLSYWSKPGWFQLHLPLPLYLLYFPATLLVAGGLRLAWRERARWRDSAAVFWALALLANAALYLAYVIAVDFQTQGRLLFPSLAAAIGSAVVALAARHRRKPLPDKPFLRYGPALSIAVYFTLQLATVALILADEGWPA